MSRQFLAVVAQLAVILAALAGLLYILKIDPETIKLVVAIGAGLIAITAIIAALSRIPLGGGKARQDDGSRALRSARRARARALRRRLRTFFGDLRRSQPGLKLWYREAAAPPLWLVLGPAQHGKSTLLRAAPNAREHAAPPAESPFHEPRFFTAAGAAFIELPEDIHEHPALDELLRTLARRRPRQPVAGILVVLRLDTLDAGDPLGDTAARVHELAAELSVRPPVVVTLTHLDRLAGIGEFCDGLTTIDRPLGVTVPACDTADALRAALRARLAEPRAWVQQRTHALLARGCSAHSHARLYAFWQHLDALLERASAALPRLVAQPLPGGESLRLRSLYALAPVTAPAESRWLDDLAQRAGGVYPGDPGAPLPPQLFVRGLFETELIRDAPLGTRLRPFLWRSASMQALLAVATAALAVYSVPAIRHAASTQEDAMQQTWNAARGAPLVPSGRPLASDSLHNLEQAARHWNTPPEAGTDWGLFLGDQLAEPSRELFTRAVCNGLIHPLAARAADLLRQRVARYPGKSTPSETDRRAINDDLHFYTLVASPAASCKLGSDNERDRFIGQLQARWKDLDPDRSEHTKPALELFAAYAGQDAICANAPLPWDPKLVSSAKDVLNRTRPEDQVVRAIISSLNDDQSLGAVDLADSWLRKRGSPVERAFTREGWGLAMAQITAEAYPPSGAGCYLDSGLADAEDRSKYCRRLREEYARRFVDAWRQAIKDLEIDPGADLQAMEQHLEDLLRENSLQEMFAKVHANTQDLDDIPCTTPIETTTRAIPGISSTSIMPLLTTSAAPKASDVAKRFAPFLAYGAHPRKASKKSSTRLPLGNYLAHTQELIPQIKKAIASPEQMSVLANDVRSRREQIVTQIEQGRHDEWTEPLKDLLLPPYKTALLLATSEEGSSLNQLWCDEVIVPMRQALGGRYPFAKDAHPHAKLAEVAKIFDPEKGAIAKFRQEHLGSLVAVSASGVRAAPVGPESERHLNAALVAFLDDAHKLGLLLFDEGGQPGVDLTVALTCSQNDLGRGNRVSKLTLKLSDGEEDQHSFICSALGTSQSFHWPAKESKNASTIITAHGSESGVDNSRYAGDFGLFLLLEEDGAPTRLARSHAFTTVIRFQKFGDVEIKFTPGTRQGGSVFFGFDPANTRFLAPMRTHALLEPPSQLFKEIPFSCNGQ